MNSLLGATSEADEHNPDTVLEMTADQVLKPPMRQVQHALSTAQNDVAHTRFEALLAAIPDVHERRECQTRHLSQSGIGAMHFALCLPSTDEALTMQDHLLRESCRRCLGIERVTTPGSLCPACPKENTPQHARRCARTGLLTARHNLVCRTVASGLRQMGLTGVRSEDYAPFVVGPRTGLHIDLTIPGGQGLTLSRGADAATVAAKNIMIDVSMVDPTADRLLPRAHCEQGYAAELRSREKHVHYNPTVFAAAQYTLVPIALETFGSMCKEGHKFWDSVATYKVHQSGGTWHKSAVLEWWRKRLSIAVQSAVSFAVDASLSRSRPQGDAGAYTRLHLLRPVAQASCATSTPAQAGTDTRVGAMPPCT